MTADSAGTATTATCADDYDPDSVSLQDALTLIRSALSKVTATTRVPLQQAHRRILAVDTHASIDVPAFDCSAMDGFAFRRADFDSPADFESPAAVELPVVGKALAGHPYQASLPSGSCVRVTTGAPVPHDADTVIMQENVTFTDGAEPFIAVTDLPDTGHFVRKVASNVSAGTTVLVAGTELLPAQLGVLASVGVSEVEVVRRLRIALLSTGDELRNPGQSLSAGMIYDSNRFTLLGALDHPGVELIDLGIVGDDREALSAQLAATREFDVMISTGGVSVGEADHMRNVLAEHGQMHLWKIAMKPGRPLTFGKLATGCVFFGLPGNPVSGLVTCQQIVQPSLNFMQGRIETRPLEITAVMQGTLKKLPGRLELQRGHMQQHGSNWVVDSAGAQDSHVLKVVADANCYIVLPTESTGAVPGEEVTVLPFEQYR